tara:strand:+ start:501 stop:1109 length:609 start_codon:yes stop_codon:yes gene_type:complete
MVKIKLTESDAIINEKIFTSLAKALNKSLPKAASAVENKLRPIIKDALLDSPEINSLSNGSLRLEFGLTSDPTSAIVDAIVSTIKVKATKVNTKLQGGFTLVMQPTNFSNLLSLPVAEQPIESGGSIPWLYWLLTLGDAVIIADFGVEFGGGRGRTGGAIMTPVNSPYKVDSRFSGTQDDNFITRAVGRVSSQVREIILKAI